jgi:hypothetical protein
LFAWAFFTAFAWAFFTAFAWGAEKGASVTGLSEDLLPRWIRFTAPIAAILWFNRGETFTFPQFSFRSWLATTVLLALVTFTLDQLPKWAMMPGLVGLMVGENLVVALAKDGRANYRKLWPDAAAPS